MTTREVLLLIRRFWREALLVLLRALPWLILLVLGLVWLYDSGWLYAWAIGGLLLAVTAWPLRRSLRRRAKSLAADLLALRALPKEGLSARELQARAVVDRLAVAARPEDIATQAAALASARRTVEAVAEVFHPGHQRAWARFTFVEALALVEGVARGMRKDAARVVPGADSIRLDLVLWGADLASRHKGLASVALKVVKRGYRLVRFLRNPIRGAAAEMQGVLDNSSDGVLSRTARTAAAQLLVRETGDVAIKLYSGRLADEQSGARPGEAPIRILLVGQLNAGKSTLANAIAGAVRCEVGPVPTTSEFREIPISSAGLPEIVLVDSPGLDGDARIHTRLASEVRRADAIVWIAAAKQPARGPDVVALTHLREAVPASEALPPVLLALAQCDLLSPVREWAPPYDLRDPAPQRKAATIRDALRAASATLDIPLDRSVPLAVPPDAEAYNVDALLAVLCDALPEARQRQIDRVLAGRGFPVGRVVSQVIEGGRALLRIGRRAPSMAS